MYTISGNGMPRKKPEGQVVNFQLKLYGEEAERWLKIVDEAMARSNNRINHTEINRQILGLDPPEEVTEKHRQFFVGSKSKPANLLGRTPPGKAHIKEVSPKTGRR